MTIRIGRLAKTTRLIRGYPVGIPTGALVTVKERKKSAGLTRYRVQPNSGVDYWVDADALSALG